MPSSSSEAGAEISAGEPLDINLRVDLHGDCSTAILIAIPAIGRVPQVCRGVFRANRDPITFRARSQLQA